MSGKSEKQLRDKRTLKILAGEVKDLGIIRKAFKISQQDLAITQRSKLRWRNTATAGIPTALLTGLALGIYIANTVMKNAPVF